MTPPTRFSHTLHLGTFQGTFPIPLCTSCTRVCVYVSRVRMSSCISRTQNLTISSLALVQSRAWRAREKWYNIGLQLGISADDLDCIKGRDAGSCFTEVLKIWLRRGDLEKTWEKLVKSLRSEPVGFGDVADGICYAKCRTVPCAQNPQVRT